MRCVFAFALLAGCSSLSSSTLSADEELLLSSINGPEETLASRAAFGAVSTEEDPDAPPLFHECDPDGFHAELFEDYDADESGALDGAEPDDVLEQGRRYALIAGRDDMERRQAEMRMHMLGLIYDTDESGDLSDAEKSVLFEDFTVRCDTLNAMLLADFDADGDGTLSESELQTAADTLNADLEEMRAEMDERAHEEGDPSATRSAPTASAPSPAAVTCRPDWRTSTPTATASSATPSWRPAARPCASGSAAASRCSSRPLRPRLSS